MPYYEDSTIEDVRSANDIVDVVGERVRLAKKGAYYFGLCPFHSEKTPSFSVSPSKQIFYCFGCGVGGDVFNFLMRYENLSFAESVREMAERAHISLPEPDQSPEALKKNDLKKNLLEINKVAALFYVDVLHSSQGKEGYEYFKTIRGLSDRIITHFGLGFSPKKPDALYRHLKDKGFTDELIKQSGLVLYNEKTIKDRFCNRVIFPIMDTNSRVTGFGGRVLGDGLPKYLNSPETNIFNKSQSIYALNFAKKSRKDFLLLAEGYMDVIALHQAGFTNAVASLGTALNEQHARILKRYTDNVILCEDSDEAGINAKIRAFPILHSAGINTKVLEMEGAKDPDEFIKKFGVSRYEECIKNAKNAFMYSIDRLKADYDLGDPAGKTEFYNAVALRLTMFEEPLERGNYIDSVSSIFFIDREELKSMVERKLELGSGRIRYESLSDNLRKNVDSLRKDSDSSRPYTIYEEKNERLLISWMINFPEIGNKVFKVLDSGELQVPIYKVVYDKLKANLYFDISFLLGKYPEDDEAQSLLASLIAESERAGDEEKLTRSDLEKGVTEAVKRLKSSNIDRKLRESENDLAKVSILLKDKNSLNSLKIFE